MGPNQPNIAVNMDRVKALVEDVLQRHSTLERFEIQYLPSERMWQLWLDAGDVRFTWPIEPENVENYVILIESFSGDTTG